MTKRPPEPLSQSEVESLLKACSTSMTGRRARALIVVMWRAGLRCAEALALRPADMDLGRGIIRVLHGKGDKSRTVGIDKWGAGEIKAWMVYREKWAPPPNASVFCSRNGKRLDGSDVRRLLPRLARRAGIQKRVHAHGLRHSFAVRLREAGVDIGAISKALGHSSIATTTIYLDHLLPADVIAKVQAVHWDTPDL